MPETKAALILANWKYEDAGLRQLVAPANDAEALAAVLGDPRVCGFEVTQLLNRPSREACEQMERFFLDRKRDDLLLLYFSCHGIKDDDGLLYFAAPDTRLVEHGRPLRSTALSADFVRSVMRASNSRRQVLILDCCYSGAFAGAILAKGDRSAGVKHQFEQGRGMVVMTASDALQYSFESDNVTGEPVNSIFTRVLVKGIETGDADHDRDGTISLDELYDYVYEHVVRENPNQRPKKWNLGVEGRIVVAQTPVVRSAELPPELVAALGSPLSRVRLGALGELAYLLAGEHKGLALAAREALEKLTGDDSRQVSAAAVVALGRDSAEQPPPPAVPPKPEPIPSAPAAKIQPAPESDPSSGAGKPPAAATVPIQTASTPEGVQPQPQIRDEDAQRKATWRSTYTYVALAGILLAAVLLYRSVHMEKQPGPSQGQKAQTQLGQAEPNKTAVPAASAPIQLPRPPFDYYADVPRAEDSKVHLTLVSSTPRHADFEEGIFNEWFSANGLTLPTYAIPDPAQQAAGNLPQKIPTKLADDRIITAINRGVRVLCIYGSRPGNADNPFSGRYVTDVDPYFGKIYFAFDFYEYRNPPKVTKDYGNDEETLGWAQVKDNILYVSTGYNGYASNSYGQNAYLNAIDLDTGRLLWRSKPLVSNSSNFLLHGDAIITGYGFSAEQHFLYVINQKDGRIVQKISVSKKPVYILDKGDMIYVLTWASNLVFKATN